MFHANKFPFVLEAWTYSPSLNSHTLLFSCSSLSGPVMGKGQMDVYPDAHGGGVYGRGALSCAVNLCKPGHAFTIQLFVLEGCRTQIGGRGNLLRF